MDKKILLLSWHPDSNTVVSAGGFRRAYEIVKRVPKDIKLVCLDTYPSYLNDLKKDNVEIVTYEIPSFIRSITQANFIIGKSLEKTYVALVLFFKILNSYRDYSIYVPYSELMQLSLPAVASSPFTGSKVTLVNLNVNHFFPEDILNPLIHKGASLNVTISKDLQQDLTKHGIQTTEINPVGIDIDYAKKIPEQEKIYDGIFIGRHTPEKGIFDALEVCHQINKSQDFKMITVGNIQGNLVSEIEDKIKELGIEDKVKLLGTVDENQKYILLKQSRVNLFTSHQEGWGIVPQEAIICNTPVVAYNLGVYQENIASCEAVILVEDGKISEFAEAVVRTLQIKPEDLQAKLDQSNKIIEKFDWDSISQKEYSLILEK